MLRLSRSIDQADAGGWAMRVRLDIPAGQVQAQGQEGQSMTTATIKDHREIREADIYRAALALARRNQVLRVDDSRPWQVVFVFDATARLDLDSFDAGGTVEARLYADSIKHLKGILARKRRGEEA